MKGSRMNPLITTQAGNRKVNLMNQNITDRHEEQEEIPRKIECRDHLFIRLHYRKISHSPDLWADARLLSLIINRQGWSEKTLNTGWFFLKVKIYFSTILSRSLLLCCDKDLLVCFIWVFWSGNWENGKYCTTAILLQSSLQAYDLLLCCVSFWINLTWDCMVHKQTQNNFLTKLPARVAKEMEGKSEYMRVPSIHNSSLSLRFESLSSDFHVVSDTVNMKWHLIMMNVWSNLQDNKQDEKLFVVFSSNFFANNTQGDSHKLNSHGSWKKSNFLN